MMGAATSGPDIHSDRHIGPRLDVALVRRQHGADAANADQQESRHTSEGLHSPEL